MKIASTLRRTFFLALGTGLLSFAIAAEMSDGEVRRIDLATQTISIKHGPIKNIGMPAMTMSFKAKDPVMLKGVKTGDKVKFTAEMPDSGLLLTSIQVVK